MLNAKINPIVRFFMDQNMSVDSAIEILYRIQDDLRKVSDRQRVLNNYGLKNPYFYEYAVKSPFITEGDGTDIHYCPELKKTVYWFGKWYIYSPIQDEEIKHTETIPTLKGDLVIGVEKETNHIFVKIDGLWQKTQFWGRENLYYTFWKKLPDQFKNLPIGEHTDGKFHEYHEGKNPCWSVMTYKTEEGKLFVKFS